MVGIVFVICVSLHQQMKWQIYHSLFEKRFLIETEQMYAEEGRAKKNELEVHDYLLHTERRIAEERDLCLSCMDSSTL